MGIGCISISLWHFWHLPAIPGHVSAAGYHHRCHHCRCHHHHHCRRRDRGLSTELGGKLHRITPSKEPLMLERSSQTTEPDPSPPPPHPLTPRSHISTSAGSPLPSPSWTILGAVDPTGGSPVSPEIHPELESDPAIGDPSSDAPSFAPEQREAEHHGRSQSHHHPDGILG